MKTTVLVAILIAVAVVVVAVFLLSVTNKGPEERSWSASVTQVTEEEETTESIEGQRVYGSISEIGKNYLIIDGSLKLEIDEQIDEHTKIYDKSDEITLDDLKAGDRVRVDYTNNLEAFRIYRYQEQ